jgi:hypothetical protein
MPEHQCSQQRTGESQENSESGICAVYFQGYCSTGCSYKQKTYDPALFIAQIKIAAQAKFQQHQERKTKNSQSNNIKVRALRDTYRQHIQQFVDTMQ